MAGVTLHRYVSSLRLEVSPQIVNVMADLLEWILLNEGVTFLLHYLNDF
jgi:hypothetical protein